MKEIIIRVKDDVDELISEIAKRKKMKKDEFLNEFIESELVKLSYKIIFKELEEAYEKERERRGKHGKSSKLNPA